MESIQSMPSETVQKQENKQENGTLKSHDAWYPSRPGDQQNINVRCFLWTEPVMQWERIID
jgi:hypothetical protein